MMMASLMPVQAHGFSDGFRAAMASSFSWAKSSCNSVLASTYSAAKKYTMPALVGLGFVVTAACVADYVGNKQELDWLTGLMDQLQKQRTTKQLSAIAILHKQLTKPYFSDLKKLIVEYNSSISKNGVSADLVFDTYEHAVITGQSKTLYESGAQLTQARKQLLADPRCNVEIGTADGCRALLVETLSQYLPVPMLSPDMTIEQAHKAGDCLQRQINDCRSHMLGLAYKKLNLDKTVHEYLIQLREHAKGVIQNIKELKSAQASVDKHDNLFNNNYKEVVVNYDALRKHLALEISKTQEIRTNYRKKFWQVPSALCAMAAIGKLSYTLARLAFKGN